MKRLVLLMAVLLLTGCSDYYRYPCQDPANWEKKECKPPVCTVTQTCPSDLLKMDEMKGDVR